MHGIRLKNRRGRHPRQRRNAFRPKGPGIQHHKGVGRKRGRKRMRNIRPAGIRGGLDSRGNRRRNSTHNNNYRGHSGKRYGDSEIAPDAKGLQISLNRPQLPRCDNPRRMQDRHYARIHSQARHNRHCKPLRHLDLRSCLADDMPRIRAKHGSRHRRRPD